MNQKSSLREVPHVVSGALTANRTRNIVVWCDTPEEMEETIAAMIAEGEIRPDQRVMCVHWEWARCTPGEHEAALNLLD
jgi:hypothetical protein